MEERVRKGMYWIAINGPSCAMFSLPLREPFTVKPRPEVLVGFPTLEEAKRAQHICLYDDVQKVQHEMQSWIRRADVKCRKLKDPEPPTEGETIWMEQ